MKYKLINTKTNEETPCDKVTIDGFDYYVSNEVPNVGDGKYNCVDKIISIQDEGFAYETDLKVIATNNPNIDIPKVVDEVEELSEKFIGCKYEDIEDSIDQIGYDSFKRGYNKSQETHPFSEEDMIEFLNYYQKTCLLAFNSSGQNHGKTTKELLQLWKEQKPKTLYYE